MYTRHTKGANQTDKISQYQIAFNVSSWQNNHPKPSTTYAIYMKRRAAKDLVGEEMDSGIPSRIARDVASEKLSTAVMDMTVDARQRLRAFKTADGEPSLASWAGTMSTVKGMRAEAVKTREEATWSSFNNYAPAK